MGRRKRQQPQPTRVSWGERGHGSLLLPPILLAQHPRERYGKMLAAVFTWAAPPKVQQHLVFVLSQHLSIPTVGGGRTRRDHEDASGWRSGEEKTPSIRHALN